jgi:2-polyprenyl-3-methyl-5-hydroxy-6-metoxy-1,4-benzoquinol methylase
VDEIKAEHFAENLLQILNHSSLALMLSLGHRTGLFDTMAQMAPATSEEIAEKAGLQERYVRECLSALFMGGIVHYDEAVKKFTLPPEHAAFLTRDAAPNNMAAFMQYIPLLGTVEDEILHCFKNGGGVPYSSFPRFQEVMAEDSGQTVLPVLFEKILPLVPGLVDRLKEGIQVLDVGCGVGRAITLMAQEFPKSQFVGYDFSPEGIEQARKNSKNLDNVHFEVRDVTHLGEKERYDFVVTFDAIHDQYRPDLVLKEIHAALKPNGVYLMQDIKGHSEIQKNLQHPLGTFLYAISCMHCMTVSLAGGGMGLGTMWGREQATQMLREAGFSHVTIKELAHDIQNDYYIIQKN